MTPTQTSLRPNVARRQLLLGAAAGIGLPLIGCGGGGGDAGGTVVGGGDGRG